MLVGAPFELPNTDRHYPFVFPDYMLRIKPDPQLERDKFNFNKSLIECWDKPSMIGAFLLVALLTIVLLLNFFDFVAISEPVQIFIIGVVMFVLIFRYFKELTVGPITSKLGPGMHKIYNYGRKVASMDSYSDTDSNNRGDRPVVLKSDPRLEKS